MKKALAGLVQGLKKYSLSLGVLSLAIIIVGTHFAIAQQGGGNNNGNSLGNHHTEFTLLVNPGEVAYIPVPKYNAPIRVDVNLSQEVPVQLATFVVSKPEIANGFMTPPLTNVSAPDVVCGPRPFQEPFSGVSYSLEGVSPCFDQNNGDIVTVVAGLTETSSENPNRIFFGIPVSALSAITITVHLWY